MSGRERSMVLEKFDALFDNYNDGKISKIQMLKSCKLLYKRLPLSWKTEGKKKERR